MKAVHTFTVATTLPAELEPLRALGSNLGWMADERVQDLFRRLDPDRYDNDGTDVLRFLATVPREQLTVAAADDEYVAAVQEVLDDLRRSLDTPRWFQRVDAGPFDLGAYFSPEFGIADGLPQYSGGLGILAGDHLKSASDLGVPLVGIGLFYHHGYFSQALDHSGWQQERFPRLNPHEMALEPVEGVRVQIDVGGVDVHVALWRATVGRVSLFLLDTDVEDNADEDRLITDRLYGGGEEQRIRQEIVLGMGGVRALQALGLQPKVFHMNEGHAGFLALERIRSMVTGEGLTFDEAVTASRPAHLFTTHTPVPAGIDRFPRALVEKYFARWADDCGITVDDLMALGHEPGTPVDAELNLAVLSLRLSAAANGVSRLHGEVSREMFAPVWPGLAVEDVPIGHVTNGVHARGWVSREMADLLDRTVGSDWPDADAARWAKVLSLSDEELAAVRRTNRQRLVTFARRWVRHAEAARGQNLAETEWTETILDPAALTIGFARRFAPYKRATLLLRDPDRLRALLSSKKRPVQLLFAGKAHPADEPGKQLLREIAQLADELDLRDRVVFLEDYGIGLARMMYRGVDVWLNNPRRPLEACGTSGMKAALNGALNCSVLDGWWDEWYDNEIGWAIPSAEWVDDLDRRDEIESRALFQILEQRVVPSFYDRDEAGMPREWLARVRASLATLGPKVTASRMQREYVTSYYVPLAARSAMLAGDGHAKARELTAWRAGVAQAWPGVRVVSMAHEERQPELGGDTGMWADVHLGGLRPDDVQVQLWYGPVDLDDELREPAMVVMRPEGDAGPGTDGVLRYAARVVCDHQGSNGFTARVVPYHPTLGHDEAARLAAWAPPIVDCQL